MSFSFFPIQDCGWVYRTNFTNSNHYSISQEYINLQYTYFDYYPCRHVHSSCIPSVSTRACPMIDPSGVPRLIPKVIPDTEPSVDSSETPSIDPNNHLEASHIPYNGRLYPSDVCINSDNVSRVDSGTTNYTFTSRFPQGSNSTADTNNNPYIVPKLLPSYDPNHHHETDHTPYVGRHSILRMNPGYSPSSYLDIALPVHAISASSDSNSSIQGQFQFRLMFLTIDPMPSSSLSIDSSDLGSSSHISSVFLNIHLAPVPCSSFNSTIHTVTMVLYFDVDSKGNEYQ